MSELKQLPLRLHHHAYTTDDHEINRRFYEDILGLPLKAMWIEHEVIDGEDVDLGHAFYGLGDGSSLAFFNFSDPEKQRQWKAKDANQSFIFLPSDRLYSPGSQLIRNNKVCHARIKSVTRFHDVSCNEPLRV